MLADPRCQQAAALDVVDHRAAGYATEHVGREKHQLPVGIDDLAVLGDDAKAIAVAVKGDADFGIGLAQAADDIGEIFGPRWIGMMVGKTAIDLAVEWNHLAADTAEKFGGECAGNAVAAIHDDLHRPGEANVANDTRDVGLADIGHAALPLAMTQRTLFGTLAQRLDRVESEGDAADDQLQTVVVRRIVAAGDRDAGVAAQFVGREVGDRRRHTADIDGVATAGADAIDQRRRQFGAGKPAVAADGNGRLAFIQRLRAKGVANATDDVSGQGFSDDAADVVGLEDFGRKRAHGGGDVIS